VPVPDGQVTDIPTYLPTYIHTFIRVCTCCDSTPSSLALCARSVWSCCSCVVLCCLLLQEEWVYAMVAIFITVGVPVMAVSLSLVANSCVQLGSGFAAKSELEHVMGTFALIILHIHL
jgi:hypothetical protein